MEYQVSFETVVEQLIVAARQRAAFRSIAREIGELLGRSWAFLKERSELRRDGHNVAIYWDERGGGSIEVGVQVVARFEATDEVVCSATPAGRVARTSHFGPHGELGPAHEAVRRWCRKNGHEIALPFWEVYGDWEEDPAKLRTDVYYLLK
jgi:effector-binding domain-containing protein